MKKSFLINLSNKSLQTTENWFILPHFNIFFQAKPLAGGVSVSVLASILVRLTRGADGIDAVVAGSSSPDVISTSLGLSRGNKRKFLNY